MLKMTHKIVAVYEGDSWFKQRGDFIGQKVSIDSAINNNYAGRGCRCCTVNEKNEHNCWAYVELVPLDD